MADATTHPAYMSLYPVKASLAEAVQHIEAQVPVMTRGEMFALLMTYHNTLIQELCMEPCQVIAFPHQGARHGHHG